VALWLTNHQMNMQVSEEFGQYFRRLPLIHSARIVCGNALRMDWNDVVSAEQVDYIFGNPPFVGKHYPEIVIGFVPITVRAWLDWQKNGCIRRSGTCRTYVRGEHLGGRRDAVREAGPPKMSMTFRGGS